MKKKVALITGGALGIGLACAKRLYKDGFDIAILDNQEQYLKKALKEISPNNDVLGILVDVADHDKLMDAFEEVVKHFGDLNVVINNAGIAPITPIETITQELFERIYNVNVGGVAFGIKAAQKCFRQLGHGGKIINATSQAGVVGEQELILYSGTKFAIRGITHVAAKELAKEGITVNCFAPGVVNTPMMADIAHKVGLKAGKDDEWGMQQFTQYITMKKITEPEEIANVVSFLAGPDSDYITGQTILCDGGMQFH